jgi:hypothetical protein
MVERDVVIHLVGSIFLVVWWSLWKNQRVGSKCGVKRADLLLRK